MNRPVTEALASIDGKWTKVFAYDASDPVSPWRVYDISLPPYANNLTEFRAGWGYWVYVTEDCILVVSG